MSLQQDFETTGQWLFRWRSYLPLFLFVIYVYSLKDYSYLGGSEKLDHIWEIFCLLVSFLGMLIRALTIGHTPKNTSGRNTTRQIADKLNTTGIYSVIRHPLYLGNFFMMLGITLFVHQVWPTLVFILLFTLYYERIMFTEEAFLEDKYKDEFLTWADKTPAIIPSFKNYIPSELPFSLRNVLRREYSGLLGVILSMFVLEELSEWVMNKQLKVDLLWLVIVLSGFVVWFVLRTLKKKTHLLDVQGR